MSGVISSLSAMPPIWEYSFVLNSAAYSSSYYGMVEGLFGSTTPGTTTPPFGTRITNLYHNSAIANRVTLGFSSPVFPFTRIIQIHVDGVHRHTCSVWDTETYLAVRTPNEATTNYFTVGVRSIRLVGLS